MMSIRAKFLFLLSVIALVPLVLVIWFDQRATRRLGLELADRAQEVLESRSADQLLLSIREAGDMVRARRQLLEAATRLEARIVERAISQPPSADAAPRLVHNGQVPETATRFFSVSERHGVPVNGAAMRVESPAAEGLDLPLRLAAAVPALADIRTRHAQEALWQRISLSGGVEAVYPAHAVPLPGGGRGWAEAASEAGEAVWNPPRVDPVTGQLVLTISAPLRGLPLAGAVAIDVPVAAMLSAVDDLPFPAARALLVEQAVRPDSRVGLRLIAERDGGMAPGAWLEPGTREDVMLDDLQAGRAAVRRIPFEGVDSLWAYGGAVEPGTNLVFVVPYHAVVAEALAARQEVLDRITNQQILMWLSLLVFAPAVMGVALFASRAVTRPVSQLAEAAKRLAQGDFAARAHIRSGDELEMLGRLFNAMVPRLEESIRMREGLALAQEVQQNLLPQAPPKVPGFDLAGISLYCDETGGDYYDFFGPAQLGEGRVAVAVGDVAGHGIAAALTMTTVRALLHAHRPEPGKLGEMMGALNRQLSADAHAGRYVTLFFGMADARARTVHWASAGHAPTLIYDPVADAFREVGSEDIPLAVDPDWTYSEFSHSGWPPGSVLVVGTDGVWETRNPAGEMFGLQAVRDLVRAHASRPAEAIARAITDALAEFRGARPRQDDVTLVVAKVE
ncbi:MAG: SpoIIE family protein phosphatase [Alphaproteobacteria bacterium]|nr:SpoIIE family protein phosphatase [Alphaproteobacteria bacterium]